MTDIKWYWHLEFVFSKIGRHLAILDTIKDSPALHRSLALKMYMAPSVSFSPLTMAPEQAITQYNTQVNNVNTHQVILCRLRQANIVKGYMFSSNPTTTGLHFWVTNVSGKIRIKKFQFPSPLTHPSTHPNAAPLNLPLGYRYPLNHQFTEIVAYHVFKKFCIPFSVVCSEESSPS